MLPLANVPPRRETKRMLGQYAVRHQDRWGGMASVISGKFRGGAGKKEVPAADKGGRGVERSFFAVSSRRTEYEERCSSTKPRTSTQAPRIETGSHPFRIRIQNG